jgi:hypothetical protein
MSSYTNSTDSTGYERLSRTVTALGMEISDSILSALRREVESCRQENKKRLAVLDPVLLGIEAVTMHVETMRADSDARAFKLLNELVEAYRLVSEELPEREDAQPAASAALKKVLDWQHSCISVSMSAKTKNVPEADRISEPASMDADKLLATVRQEIAATGMMAVRESAALLELVHVRKTAKTAPADISEYTDLGSVVSENISSLQRDLHQEMSRLRHEFSTE